MWQLTYSDRDTTTLAILLRGQTMRLAEVRAPVTAADGHDGQLGDDDGGADGGRDFL